MTLDVREIRQWLGPVQLRKADEDECLLGGMRASFALERSCALSLASYVATYDDEPIAFWGYTPQTLLGQGAFAWLLTTPLADRFPLVLGVGSKRFVDQLLTLYPHIIVNVDPSHAMAMRWLLWLGFTPDGPDGPFIQMRKSRWAH